MIEINSYEFGKITINGKTYGDVIIMDNAIIERDWKKGSHGVSETELEKLLKNNPDIVIIGTGKYETLIVEQAIKNKLMKIKDVYIENTSLAVETFNKIIKKNMKINALFHTTC